MLARLIPITCVSAVTMLSGAMSARPSSSLRTLLIIFALGCAGETNPSAAAKASSVERVTIGDTTVVRNFGAALPGHDVVLHEEISIGKSDGVPQELFSRIGAVVPTHDGGALVFEAEAIELRQFDSTGKFVRVIGRKGPGPGEYRWAPTGITISSAGDIYSWEGQSQRVNVYAADGKFTGVWTTPGARGLIPSGGWIDPNGLAYTRVPVPHRRFPDSVDADGSKLRSNAAIRTTLDGKVIDSLFYPEGSRAVRTQRIRVTEGFHEPTTIGWSIPLEPGIVGQFSRLGYFFTADAAKYAIILHRPSGGPLRIEFDRERVPASEQERRDLFDADAYDLSEMGATPAITLADVPQVKPFFKSIRADYDGRVWATLYQPGRRVAIEPSAAPKAGGEEPALPRGPAPTHRWVEPLVYDVFAPTGEFLGTVRLPERSTFGAARDDKLWLVVRDELDVPRVVRYRMQFGTARR